MSPDCCSSSLVHPQHSIQSGPTNMEPCATVCLVAQSSPAFCDPIDCIPPGFSVRGILQARKLELGAMPSSRGPSQPRVSCIGRRFFTSWATRESNGALITPVLCSNPSCGSHLTQCMCCSCVVPPRPPAPCYLLKLISSPFHWPPCPSTSIPGTVPGEAVLSALGSLWMGSLWITLETQWFPSFVLEVS